MLGHATDDSNQEELRLLPRPLFRYEIKEPKDDKNGNPKVHDGALFGYTMGTDPEVVLLLEAVGPSGPDAWQYAFVRSTSSGLRVKLDNDIVWTAAKGPKNRDPNLPHFTMRRLFEK